MVIPAAALEWNIEGVFRYNDERGNLIEIPFDNSKVMGSANWHPIHDSIPATTTVTIWDGGVVGSLSPASVIDRAFLIADGPLELEFLIEDVDPAEELNSIPLVADWPFLIHDGEAYFDHGAGDIYTGTLGQFDRLRARNAGATAVNIVGIIGADV